MLVYSFQSQPKSWKDSPLSPLTYRRPLIRQPHLISLDFRALMDDARGVGVKQESLGLRLPTQTNTFALALVLRHQFELREASQLSSMSQSQKLSREFGIWLIKQPVLALGGQLNEEKTAWWPRSWLLLNYWYLCHKGRNQRKFSVCR